MAGSMEELLDLLYTEIEEAKNMPLNNDKCVIDRDRILDLSLIHISEPTRPY